MEISVLGTAGGEAPGLRLTGFRLGSDVLLDAGTIGLQLLLSEQRKIRHVLLTHSHLDHIHALPFLLDNLIGRVAEPVRVYSSTEILAVVHQHLFNNEIWPDFTVLPSPENPILKFCPLSPGAAVAIGDITVEAIPMKHSFAAFAYLISFAGGSLVFTGDTGPVEPLWQRLSQVTDLKAIFMECSFPRRQQEMAKLTNHLSTADIPKEISKIQRPISVPIYLYHLKPEYIDEISQEAATLKPLQVIIPQPGDYIRL